MLHRTLLIAALAAASLLAAPAALAAPLGTESEIFTAGTTGGDRGAQNGPALVVDPADPLRQAAAASDWRASGARPQTRLASSTDGGHTWQDAGLLAHPPNVVGGGSVSLAWGIDHLDGGGVPVQPVYAAEVARGTDVPSPCQVPAGIYLGVSSDGGVSWLPAKPLAITTETQPQSLREPRIATDATGRLLVVYTRETWATPDHCTAGAPQTAETWLAFSDDAGDTVTRLRLSAAGGLVRRPALTVLADGSLVVAAWDAAASAVVSFRCAPAADPAYVCGEPVVVDPQVADPSSAAGTAAPPSPQLVDVVDPATTRERIVVAWAEANPGAGADVFTATSHDGAASYTPPGRASTDQLGGNQLFPSLAAAPNGRVDLAFLDGRNGASWLLPLASSSNPPSSVLLGETWSEEVVASPTRINPFSVLLDGGPTLGQQVAATTVPGGPGLPPATGLAWPDTRNADDGRDQDVFFNTVEHGSLAPVLGESAVVVPRGRTTTIRIPATDGDADPLRYALAGGPEQAGAGAEAVIGDPNRAELTYTPPPGSGELDDRVQVTVTDGVQSVTSTMTLFVRNSAPVIACATQTVARNGRLPIPFGCARDDNGDPLEFRVENVRGGRIVGDSFFPAIDYLGEASFDLVAWDGFTETPYTIHILVEADPGPRTVELRGPEQRTAVVGRPASFHAVPADRTVSGRDVEWTILPAANGAAGLVKKRGMSISHVFTKPGRYVVTASAGRGPADSLTVTVTQAPLALLRAAWRPKGELAIAVLGRRAGRLSVALAGGPARTRMLGARGGRLDALLRPSRRPRLGTILVVVRLRSPSGLAELRRAVIVPPRLASR